MNTAAGRRIETGILYKSQRLVLFAAKRLWNCLPLSVRDSAAGQAYARHLHHFVCTHTDRQQSFTTFFLRNRPELELLCQLANQTKYKDCLNIAVLACSKGAEAYSIAWTIRKAHPELHLKVVAVDISQEILDFAMRGIYPLGESKTETGTDAPRDDSSGILRNTLKDQEASIFERMTSDEIDAMFEMQDQQARVCDWIRDGITWLCADAEESEAADHIGIHDVVFANRFLCHMPSSAASRSLRNIGRLVRPGGYLFVSGIDLDVRTTVALEMGWKPMPDLIREIHNGDPSIREGWPLEYWGLEPFDNGRSDWRIRYASVFQIGQEQNRVVQITGEPFLSEVDGACSLERPRYSASG